MKEGVINDPRFTKQEIKEKLKQSQAIDEDYKETGYDRGHLNPNAFQCDDTLTNAAPMNPRFNRVQWRNLEHDLKELLRQNCPEPKEKAFFVTGAVPSQQMLPSKDNNGNPRVVVPSHFWTAVCCDHTNSNMQFAFAFLGANKAASIPGRMTVKDLNEKLKGLYGGNLPIQIFKDPCNENSQRADQFALAIHNKLRKTNQNAG